MKKKRRKKKKILWINIVLWIFGRKCIGAFFFLSFFVRSFVVCVFFFHVYIPLTWIYTLYMYKHIIRNTSAAHNRSEYIWLLSFISSSSIAFFLLVLHKSALIKPMRRRICFMCCSNHWWERRYFYDGVHFYVYSNIIIRLRWEYVNLYMYII